MSRRGVTLTLFLLLAALPICAVAQDDDTPRVDLEPDYGPPVEDCSRDRDAATISGEIIVCRRIGDRSEYRLRAPDAAQKRFAEETMDQANPKPPDFIRDCHEQGWPPGCVRVGSVPPPAHMIDFDALPDAPPGSDADRIARGLPPLGQDVPLQADTVSLSGSASPAAQPSD